MKGEHIDYNGFGVLPMAIHHNVTMAVLPLEKSSELWVENVDEQYSSYKADKNELDIRNSDPQWIDYFLCGYRGMLELLATDKSPVFAKHFGIYYLDISGMQILVHGSVPPGSGLSSSSALVCCAALATLRAHTDRDFDLHPRRELAEMCAKCERYVGMEGGGMDQAISMLAQEGTAKKIDFNPVRTEDVLLPRNAVFFVLHSGVTMHKGTNSKYNERVVECRIAAQLIAKSRGIEKWARIRQLGQLQKVLGLNLDEMKAIVLETLHENTYDRAELLDKLHFSNDEFMEICLSGNTKHMNYFKLHDRAQYVYSEAIRVDKFVQICRNLDQHGILSQLGLLMNDSHDEAACLYECSCSQLDRLVDDCRKLGAFGARLTGAGWGGCVIALLDEDKAELFRQAIIDRFYSDEAWKNSDLNGVLFRTRPGPGASVVLL